MYGAIPQNMFFKKSDLEHSDPCSDYIHNAAYMGMCKQFRTARLLSVVGYRDHFILSLKDLYWSPICFGTQFERHIITFEAQNGLELGHSKSHLILYC